MSLVAGIADDLRAAGIKVFGPSKAAAQLEGSKGFTKELCAEFNIPTAGFDGDQADPRNFNAAQYETRVQGLVEAMEANDAKKGN